MWELYSNSFKTKSRLLLQAKSVEPSKVANITIKEEK